MNAKMQLIEMSPETLAELIVQKAQALFEKFVNTCIPCTEKEILTPKEVCELLDIDDSTLWHWRNKGKVKAYGLQGRRYYLRSEIMQALIPLTPNKRTNLKAA